MIKQHIKFLEDRLIETKRKVVQLSEYKEMKAIELLLTSFKEDSSPIPLSAEEGVSRESYKGHDMNNSPARKIKMGKRVRGVYDLIEKFCIEKNGVVELPEVVNFLKNVHGMKWNDKNQGETQSRLVSYIKIHNRTCPHHIRLHLWPSKKAHEKRAGKYQKIIYVGKQRVN